MKYERFILFVWFYFGKMWKFSEKRPFFRADMAGLGKYHMGGYGRIGVYRVKKWPCRRVEFRGQGPHLYVKDHISIGQWHNMPSDIDVYFNSSLIGP